ncbi:alkaline shock response membrane anchor protein AmaP [Enterococcus ratti]|uniref:Alkaline shock response membrane anchor protein AmaP n=1 Tax=Enterococcus ratti TaxID=150033 RepID=A0A1L8WSM8_9ENTE|nr:alkaline shock response membrane anchor protein AmaP [Enterococcus ratti]OJG83993.1 hypothetical protein RV14_GL000170 [Enterococcus ratti]
MNKGWKIIGILVSLFLLLVLLGVVFINVPYLMPQQLERLRFFVATNNYFQYYLFWAAVVFAILVLILLFVVLFYPKSKGTFVLKQNTGQLTLDKKAIEGLVRSQLHEEEFVSTPRIRVRSTKNKIYVHVKGDLKRTSSLIGKTSMLMQDIERQVKRVLGTEQNIAVAVTYSGYEHDDRKAYKHARVE